MSKSENSTSGDYVSAEAVLRLKGNHTGFLRDHERRERVLPENLKSYLPRGGDFAVTAKKLRDLGFSILDFGSVSITIAGNVGLFESECKAHLKKIPRILPPGISKSGDGGPDQDHAGSFGSKWKLDRRK